MPSTLHLCRAELLKLRRTLAFWVVLLAPGVVLLLQFLMFHERAAFFARDGKVLWDGYLRNCFVLWSAMMMPLYITLQTSLLAALEHSDDRWRNLLALPVARWRLYLVKAAIPFAMVCLSSLILTTGAIASGALLGVLKPILKFPAPLPWDDALHYTALSIGASLLVLSIQQWIALRFPSFAVSAGAGITGTIAGTLLMQSPKYGPWWPWSLAVQFISTRSGLGTQVLIYSAAGAVLVTALATWEFSRREFR